MSRVTPALELESLRLLLLLRKAHQHVLVDKRARTEVAEGNASSVETFKHEVQSEGEGHAEKLRQRIRTVLLSTETDEDACRQVQDLLERFQARYQKLTGEKDEAKALKKAKKAAKADEHQKALQAAGIKVGGLIDEAAAEGEEEDDEVDDGGGEDGPTHGDDEQ